MKGFDTDDLMNRLLLGAVLFVVVYGLWGLYYAFRELYRAKLAYWKAADECKRLEAEAEIARKKYFEEDDRENDDADWWKREGGQ